MTKRRKKLADAEIKPGMIVSLKERLGEKWEVLEVHGDEKILLRREDLDRLQR